MNPNSSFNVGGTPLDRNKYNADRFAKLADIAARVPVEGNKSADEWHEVADRIKKNDNVSKEDLAAFQELNKAAKPEMTRIRKELAATGFKDEKLKAQMVPFNLFMGPFGRLTESLRLANARVAVEALAGASFGPLSVVAAYHAYANLAQAPLQDLVSGIQKVEAGKAENYYPGNAVQEFHHEQVWQKMNQMLDAGLESAKAGKPVEINAQYYELTSPDFVSKLAQNAAAGNKVRINVDPGRLVAYKGNTIEMDDYPDKMRTILQFSQAKGDIGISTYPVTKILGDPNDLMHRKGLRVGDEFFLSGMNANSGSGENIDAGYSIQGPAARQLVHNFARDVKDSQGHTDEDVYGEKAISTFKEKTVLFGARGIVSLIDALSGPSPAGTPLEKFKDFKSLNEWAKDKGFDLRQMFDCPAAQLDPLVTAALTGGPPVPVTDFTKDKILELSQKAMNVTRTPENVSRLNDISLPKGDPQGNTVVSLADQPTERETELIMAIQKAEKFIFVPAFVMTKPIAAALVAKNNEMKEAGKEFDVRVIADPGIYPDGGTPNEDGVRMLEDGGVPVRWALLPRCGEHDRKIHAKELLTDKSEFFGSTNFSKKGLRENWEHSGVVHFDDGDAHAQEELKGARAHFEDLWEHFSYECNSLKLAGLWKKNYTGPDKLEQIEDARFGAIRKVLKGVEKYEEETGSWMLQQMQKPEIQTLMHQMIATGIDEMSAAHLAVRKNMGDEAYFGALQGLPSYGELKRLAPRS
ncbi:phospholipase D family protein [bacterium]|nr:phospholipase D family protein [bacterium]